MRLFVLLLALAPLAAAPAQRPVQEPARCRPGADKAQSQRQGPARPRPLIEMPDARPVLAVQRRVDGCSVLLVREGGRIIEEPVGARGRRRVFRP